MIYKWLKIHTLLTGADQAELAENAQLINHIIGNLTLEMNKTKLIYYKS